MRVLGYGGGIDGYPALFGASHDAAAALVVDGRIVAACDEERFTRDRGDRTFPIHAMDHCLRAGGLTSAAEATLVCCSTSLSQLFAPEMLATNRSRLGPAARVGLGAGLAIARRWGRITGHDEARSERVFKKRTGVLPEPGRFRAVPHQLCHAASAFYPSPFDEALCLALGARGDGASALLAIGRGERLGVLRQLYAPNSVGSFLAHLTTYLGFGPGDEDEAVGLAPHGDPARFRAYFERMVQSEPDGSFAVDPGWISHLAVRDAVCPPGVLYPRSMTDALGPPRLPDEPIVQRHADIAAGMQEALERVVLRMLERARAATGQRHLCLAGGVAFNGPLNGKIARSGLFDRVWVQPASHDGGTALGAALYGYHALLGGERSPRARAPVFLGPELGNASLSRAILELGQHIRCHRPPELHAVAARALADGKVVAWFQGRAEWGPRALGHRSVLADPRRAESKDRVGAALRRRQACRPFAPACLREHADAWFDLTGVVESPFMLFAVPVREAKRAQIPAVTQVDGSACVETVDRDDDPRFHALLRAFHEITAVPILLHASFELQGEPIVQSPRDAIRCFLAAAIDLLVVGDTVIEKRGDVARRARDDGDSASPPAPRSSAGA
jgi:carbamoyltransferase